jgi:4-amino-4-deoxychorismate lyase
MTPIVLINGEEQSKISIFNRNMQYGDGLFETCVAKGNQILFWSSHLERLSIGCERLNIQNVDESDWISDINKAFALSAHSNCIVKLILSRGDSSRGYGYKEDIVPVRVVIISEIKKTVANNSFSLEYSDSGYHSNPQLAGIKHCNRLEQILARSNLSSDEGIMLDENENVIIGNTLLTPKLDKCGVVGSRRSLILELAKSLNIEVKEDLISADKLKQADEVFISNSVIGIQSVKSIEGDSLGDNPLTEEIKAAFKGKTQDIKSWTCF